MKIIVIDYGMGNVSSMMNMTRKAGGVISSSSDPKEILQADRLILPGVGAFDRAMENLNSRGLIEVLKELVLQRCVPILGVCLGMQLFCRRSEEGKLPGLGWIQADTIRFQPSDGDYALKIPHMGWNGVEPMKDDSLIDSLPPEPRFYFVHSYYVRCDDPRDELLRTTHGIPFTSAVRHSTRKIWGTQFHPEKSHKYGLAIMKAFLGPL